MWNLIVKAEILKSKNTKPAISIFPPLGELVIYSKEL